MPLLCFKFSSDSCQNQCEVQTALPGNISDKHLFKRPDYAICISLGFQRNRINRVYVHVCVCVCVHACAPWVAGRNWNWDWDELSRHYLLWNCASYENVTLEQVPATWPHPQFPLVSIYDFFSIYDFLTLWWCKNHKHSVETMLQVSKLDLFLG